VLAITLPEATLTIATIPAWVAPSSLAIRHDFIGAGSGSRITGNKTASNVEVMALTVVIHRSKASGA
jgi:hypothetical protein